MIDEAPCGLGCSLLTPHSVFVVDTRQPPEGPEQQAETGSQRKTVKSMAVSQRALISSPQSSKVAPLALRFAPSYARKKRFVKDSFVSGMVGKHFLQCNFVARVKKGSFLLKKYILVFKHDPQIPSCER